MRPKRSCDQTAKKHEEKTTKEKGYPFSRTTKGLPKRSGWSTAAVVVVGVVVVVDVVVVVSHDYCKKGKKHQCSESDRKSWKKRAEKEPKDGRVSFKRRKKNSKRGKAKIQSPAKRKTKNQLEKD
jgi:hypothetical protein